MDALRRSIRRQQIDSQLAPFAGLAHAPVPKGGWLHAIREALGMSLEQFAQRLGLASASTVYQLEHAEVEGTLTLKRMRAAADALGCDLVVAIVPRQPLQKMAEQQARQKASQRLARVSHTLALEAQPIGQHEMDILLNHHTAEILAKGGSHLWS